MPTTVASNHWTSVARTGTVTTVPAAGAVALAPDAIRVTFRDAGFSFDCEADCSEPAAPRLSIFINPWSLLS